MLAQDVEDQHFLSCTIAADFCDHDAERQDITKARRFRVEGLEFRVHPTRLSPRASRHLWLCDTKPAGVSFKRLNKVYADTLGRLHELRTVQNATP